MRPKIMPSRSIKRSICYNENKVVQNQAQCLYAANFLKDTDRLTIDDKLLRFERRQQLNERVTTSLHITLNFDPADTLPDEKMRRIATLYMEIIGFEKQPYLVYRHHDAGHPHCHIVATHIQRNGDPIELFRLGENQSEKARLHIEEKFDLVTAERKRQTQYQQQKRLIKKITYGQGATTRALSEAIHFVTENYKYGNLEELNATLRLYNVEACPVRGNTRQRQGLLYRVLDEQGHYIGRPLKASFFDFKPTLANLEKKFVENQALKLKYQHRINIHMMWELDRKDLRLSELEKRLERQRIVMSYKLDKHHQVSSLFFFDFEYKCVYSENDLHPRCHRQQLQQLIDRHYTLHQHEVQKQAKRQRHHHTIMNNLY